MTVDKDRFTQPLDVIKFICKEFWTALFRKQCSNLKTNHKGAFVLTDTSFAWAMRMSTRGMDAVQKAQPFLWFPSGLLKGALASLGLDCTVYAESPGLPCVIFHIRVVEGP